MGWITWILMMAGADQCIKEEIEAAGKENFPRELKGSRGKITLHKSHNQGFPFQVLKERPELVKTVPLIMVSALGGVLGFLLPKKGFLLEKTALSLTLGGALSNLHDRLHRGYVVDYFSINAGKLKKVIFNLGDMMIFAGAVLMFLSQIRAQLKED